MYYKIEKSGCCVRKGMVRVRYDFFLDPDDYGYDKCYVDVPLLPNKIPEMSKEEFSLWVEKLPKVKQLNPFHSHFIYFEPTVTDKDLDKIGDERLKESFNHWKDDKKIKIKNTPISPVIIDSDRLLLCDNRLASIEAKN